MPRDFCQHPSVDDDLEDCFTYIARDNEEAAGRFLKAVGVTFKLVAEFPDIGSKYQTKTRKLQGLLMFPISKPFRKYLIFYRVVDGQVRILHVKHGMRQLEKRLKEDLRE